MKKSGPGYTQPGPVDWSTFTASLPHKPVLQAIKALHCYYPLSEDCPRFGSYSDGFRQKRNHKKFINLYQIKNKMFRLLFILLVCLPCFCQAQSLTIKNGATTKTFAPETYYEFYFGDIHTQCCNTTVKGMVTRVYTDSIQVRLNAINLYNKDLDFLTDLQVDMTENNLLYTLPKAELLNLTAYKNKKQYDRKGSIWGVGGVLILTGLVTLANSYDLDTKNFREGVLISGGAQFGLGLTLMLINRKKNYSFRDGWHF